MSSAPRLGVQTDPNDRASLVHVARAAEAAGLYAVFVPDHPSTCASPFVALAAAASATDSIRLGAYVLNTGIRHPLQTAVDLNTLDLVSDGRAILAVGAGHTPAEWTMQGLDVPSPTARVSRMIRFTELVRSLSRGETVSSRDEGLVLDEASVTTPRGVQDPIPLLVGGNGPRVLRFAGATSDTVSVSGLGPTLADGHTHVAKWSHPEITASIEHIRSGAAGRNTPVIEALVQHIEVTDHRSAALDGFARRADIDPALLDDIPFVLVGSAAHIADQMVEHRERWGFTSYVARADRLADLCVVADQVR